MATFRENADVQEQIVLRDAQDELDLELLLESYVDEVHAWTDRQSTENRVVGKRVVGFKQAEDGSVTEAHEPVFRDEINTNTVNPPMVRNKPKREPVPLRFKAVVKHHGEDVDVSDEANPQDWPTGFDDRGQSRQESLENPSPDKIKSAVKRNRRTAARVKEWLDKVRSGEVDAPSSWEGNIPVFLGVRSDGQFFRRVNLEELESDRRFNYFVRRRWGLLVSSSPERFLGRETYLEFREECIQNVSLVYLQTSEESHPIAVYDSIKEGVRRTYRQFVFREKGLNDPDATGSVGGVNNPDLSEVFETAERLGLRKLVSLAAAGETQQSIAETLGISQPAVHKRLRMIRDKLEK